MRSLALPVSAGPKPADPSDEALLPRLRRGEEAAFRVLVRRYHVRLVAVARSARLSPEAAEEAVQDAWIAVMRNVGTFEARSSLRTWLTGIVLNVARKSFAKSRHVATFAEMSRADANDDTGFDADAFLADGHWREAPWHWSEIDLERGLAGRQLWGLVEEAIARLPEDEAYVIRMRDIEGFGARETEAHFGIGEARQRMLLDRARLKVRRVFDAVTRDASQRRPGAALSSDGSAVHHEEPRA